MWCPATVVPTMRQLNVIKMQLVISRMQADFRHHIHRSMAVGVPAAVVRPAQQVFQVQPESIMRVKILHRPVVAIQL